MNIMFRKCKSLQKKNIISKGLRILMIKKYIRITIVNFNFKQKIIIK